MPINNFTDGELITAPRLNEMVGQLNTRYYTIDQSAGRTVKVWDYLNSREQMIYGDTGVRDISAQFSGRTAGLVYLSRTGAFVELFLNDLQTTLSGSVTPLVLPPGFRPPNWYYYRTVSYWDSETSTPFRIKSDGSVEFRNLTAGNTLKAVLQFKTIEPWPSTLPGTAVGSIPA